MRLFEYQAKELLSVRGLAVPASGLADSPEQAARAAERIGCPCMLKAQVLQGGRGKAGLIRKAGNPLEAEREAAALLAGSPPGPPGPLGRRVLVERYVVSLRELYLCFTIDPVAACDLLLASASGGVEIERLAASDPEAVIREPVDPLSGPGAGQARGLARRLGLNGPAAKALPGLLARLHALFHASDAELVEINPLFLTADQEFVAGDAKIILDDNALFRHPEFSPTREHFASETEFEAHQQGFPYVQFRGDISLMCAGAGLTNTVYDLVRDFGGEAASYLEFGGPNYRRAVEAMELCLKTDSKVILIVTFGTIARADVMAEGIVSAIAALKPNRPIVTCIRGTNEEAAAATLKAAGLEPLSDTEEAVRRAVALARGGPA
jgi:succinyl-CoA synthetase beta subunit